MDIDQSLDHDALCAAQATSLIEEGFMDEEFTCYGTVFIKDNKPRYYVCSTETSINRTFNECILSNIYPSPPKYFVLRVSVPAGMRESIRQKFKYRTAQSLKSSYPPSYFQALQELAQISPDSQAMPLFNNLKKQLENRFDTTALAIFKELLQQALISKHLTVENYHYWLLWLNDEYHKTEDDWCAPSYYHRTYSGYGTIMADEIVYSQNAFETVITERRNKEITAGKLVTPIIRQCYSAASFAELKQTHQMFNDLLKHYLNNSFAEIIKQLADLPSAIPPECFNYWFEQVKETKSQAAIDSLKYYGHIWNITNF